jgi:hypothetical protein
MGAQQQSSSPTSYLARVQGFRTLEIESSSKAAHPFHQLASSSNKRTSSELRANSTSSAPSAHPVSQKLFDGKKILILAECYGQRDDQLRKVASDLGGELLDVSQSDAQEMAAYHEETDWILVRLDTYGNLLPASFWRSILTLFVAHLQCISF